MKFHSSATDQTGWAVGSQQDFLIKRFLTKKKKNVSIVAKDRADRIESAIN